MRSIITDTIGSLSQVVVDSDNFRTRVASPCIRHCTLDAQDVCLGCHRSIEEICRWGKASDDERRLIIEAAEQRGRSRQ